MKKSLSADTRARLIKQGIFLITEITHSNLDEIGRWILKNRPTKKRFTILINSIGGSPSAVVRFASSVCVLGKDVVIHGVAFDTCGSAALALLQCCHKRSAVKYTSFFIHHIRTTLKLNCQVFDKEKIDKELSESKKVEEEIISLQCARTGLSRERWMKLAEYGEGDGDTPIFTDVALKLGLIDDVLDSFPCL